jgi:hypothetical protein
MNEIPKLLSALEAQFQEILGVRIDKDPRKMIGRLS